MADRTDSRLYYVCKYTPLELLASYGFSLERLDPELDGLECGESLGHPNLCAYGQAILKAVEEGNISQLFLVNCCDVCRRVYDILLAQKGLAFLYLMDLPHKKGPAEVDQLRKELLRLNAYLEDFTGQTFAEAQARQAWREGIQSAQAARPKQDHVVLTGAHGNKSLKKTIKGITQLPVLDDTCTGNRELAPESGKAFFQDYSAALLSQPSPCMRMQFSRAKGSPDSVEEGLQGLGREDPQDLGKGEPQGLGTICHTIKFCDYYSFQYKKLRDQTQPLLKIETDCTAQSQGQITTRLEAFAELIRPQGKGMWTQAEGIHSQMEGVNPPTERAKLQEEGMRPQMEGVKPPRREGTRPQAEGAQPFRLGKSRAPQHQYVCGIDSGSSSTNAVILDEGKNIVGSAIVSTGGGAEKSGQQAFAAALAAAALQEKDIRQVISTGYGRNNLQLSQASITEISCHAKGASFLYPQARTVIDIGGQDSKVIVLDTDHHVVNFVMNDKCAAGTGRFLETMAKTLDVNMEEMSVLGLRWKKPVTISSTCTVFAESEVVSLIAQNTDLPDIINGLNQSIASKTLSLVKRAKGQAPYIMTGGVANNVGVVKALEKELGTSLYVPPEAQLCGALGAALFALDQT